METAPSAPDWIEAHASIRFASSGLFDGGAKRARLDSNQ